MNTINNGNEIIHDNLNNDSDNNKKKKKKKKICWIIFLAIYCNQFKLSHYYADILEDDDGDLCMVFIDALVLSAAGSVFDSSYEATIDGESKSARVISQVTDDYFDYEY